MSSERPKWLVSHPSDQIFKFYHADKNVGQIWYRLVNGVYEIDYIEVIEEYRGQGYGIELLLAFKSFCQKSQASEIWLEVSDKNKIAIRAYVKAGFIQVGLRPQYYSDGSNAITMSLSLDSNSSVD